MKVKEVLTAIGAERLFGEDKAEPKQLMTKWGEALLESKHPEPLSEYPRPQLVRDNYTILNGYWQYAFTETSGQPSVWDGEILVPFYGMRVILRLLS